METPSWLIGLASGATILVSSSLPILVAETAVAVDIVWSLLVCSGLDSTSSRNCGNGALVHSIGFDAGALRLPGAPNVN